MAVLSKCSIITSLLRVVPVLKYAAASEATRILGAVRGYSNKSGDCSKAWVDIPPKVDPVCPKTCEKKQHKKQGVIHKIKLKILQGGTNFGTPFLRLKCPPEKDIVKVVCDGKEEKTAKSLALTKEAALAKREEKRKEIALTPLRPGVQVSVLGADTGVGTYAALLLKQCPAIRKLRLYEAQDSPTGRCNRNLSHVVEDLKHINTNCFVQSFSSCRSELERCLQNSDIVLMLESSYVSADMPYEKRFLYQAPIVKQYADAISAACPKAFVIVCATPIDCMVPLVAQTLKETNWFDPRKLLGSVAVPEMRASTIAARALCLEPKCTKVPCVGGTEGEALVPLFSKAVELFDFAQKSAAMMTNVVRATSMAVAQSDTSADLSEAHALAGLTIKVAHALLCSDVSRVTGFVATDASQMISPAKYLAIDLLLNHKGICKKFDFPSRLNKIEVDYLDTALSHLCYRVNMAKDWHAAFINCEKAKGKVGLVSYPFAARQYKRLENCSKTFIPDMPTEVYDNRTPMKEITRI